MERIRDIINKIDKETLKKIGIELAKILLSEGIDRALKKLDDDNVESESTGRAESKRTLESKLDELEYLRRIGKLSEDEYRTAREELIKSYVKDTSFNEVR